MSRPLRQFIPKWLIMFIYSTVMRNKKVQREGTKRSQPNLVMPQYLTLKHNTYYFRQNVPAELRSHIGRREIKKSLGTSYPAAVSKCKRLAVETDELIAKPLTQLDSIPPDPFSREGIRRTKLVKLTSSRPNWKGNSPI